MVSGDRAPRRIAVPEGLDAMLHNVELHVPHSYKPEQVRDLIETGQRDLLSNSNLFLLNLTLLILPLGLRNKTLPNTVCNQFNVDYHTLKCSKSDHVIEK